MAFCFPAGGSGLEFFGEEVSAMGVLQKVSTFIARIARHRGVLKRYRNRVDIDPTTRLQSSFSVDFMVEPEDRVYVRCGTHGIVNAKVTFESRSGIVEIGNRVYFGGGTVICRQGIKIGNDVTIAWGVTIYDHNSHSLDWRQRAKMVNHFYHHYGSPCCYEELDWTDVSSAPIVIEDKVWIGFDAVLLRGVRIGEGAVIGARSVVTQDVEPYTVVAGNPAVVVKRIER